MTDFKRRDTEEGRRYWDFVEKEAAEVSQWPEWKRSFKYAPNPNAEKELAKRTPARKRTSRKKTSAR